MPISAAEQYFVELQNRARLDPLAEAARYGIDLNQGLAAGTLDGTARNVLAPNEILGNAANDHSVWMVAVDIFSHTGVNGSSPGDRMVTAGYTFTGNWTWGENIAWSGSSGAVNLETAIAGHHAGLFRSAGHRTNTLNDAFREIGVGQSGGQFLSNGSNWNSSMLTSVFATSGSSVFVTGVAYTDLNGDQFYSIGEGRSGVTFQVIGGSGPVTNGAAGGYAVATAANASTQVRIGHGAFVTDLVVDTAGGNAKIDLVGDTLVLSSADVVLVSGAVTDLRLLGVEALDATGNAGANRLTGNSGANGLFGDAGNDTLTGGDGNDQLSGGAGADVLDGGAGTRDQASYALETAGVRAVLGGAASNIGSAVGDSYIGIEDLIGSAFNDLLGGDGAANQLFGGNGNDAMDGGAGADTLMGDAGNDMLVGSLGADVLNGGAGAGDGASYWNAGAGLRADLLYATSNTADAAGDSYAGIENLQGSGLGDVLGGDNAANAIGGLAGNDAIDGRGGNDTMAGDTGNDTLIGGYGNDIAYGGAGADDFVFQIGRDVVMDFTDNVDELVLCSMAWGGGARTVEQILDAANITVIEGVGVRILLSAWNSVEVRGVTSAAQLLDDIVLA